MYAAVFIHEEDMAFVVIPGQNDSQTLHERGRRNAVLNSGQVWPGGIVPYQIASVFNGKYDNILYNTKGVSTRARRGHMQFCIEGEMLVVTKI